MQFASALDLCLKELDVVTAAPSLAHRAGELLLRAAVDASLSWCARRIASPTEWVVTRIAENMVHLRSLRTKRVQVRVGADKAIFHRVDPGIASSS